MGSYFKGWRRKIGVVALGLACAFMQLWVRSYPVPFRVVLAETKGPFVDSAAVESIDGALMLYYSDEPEVKINWMLPRIGRYLGIVNTSATNWSGRFIGFGWGAIPSRQGSFVPLPRYKIWKIPYWSVVLPLTLLSAWLLLSKPKRLRPRRRA